MFACVCGGDWFVAITSKLTLSTGGLLPGFMLFSSYDSSEGIMYVAMILIEILMSLIIITAKYIQEDAISKQLDALEGEHQLFLSWL